WHRGEDVVDAQAAVECARVGRLNDAAVGDRVAVGEADLNQGGAAPAQLVDESGGSAQVRIAGGHERHERLAAFGAELAKQRVDGFHGSDSNPRLRFRGPPRRTAKPQADGQPSMSSPCNRATSKQSLSPRPEKQITTTSSLLRFAACRIASTTACAVSSAG